MSTRYLFPYKSLSGVCRQRDPAARAFLKPLYVHTKDMRGTSEEGRRAARALRAALRESLGRKPTAREYRAAKGMVKNG